MASERFLTDEQVEAEILRLKASPYVKLAKKGKALDAQGVTMSTLELEYFEED